MPLVISVLFYAASDKVIKEEINKANQASMKHLRQLMDDNLRSFRKISVDIGWDLQVVDIMRSKQPLTTAQKLNMVDIIKNLKMQSTSIRLIDFLYVYFSNNDTVLSSSAMNGGEELYRLYHQSPNYSFEDWKKMMNSVHQWDYTSLPRQNSDRQGYDCIAFMQTIPIEYPDKPQGTIVLMIGRDKISSILNDVKWINESTVFITDEKNGVLASSNPVQLPETLSYHNLKNPGQFVDGSIGGEDVVVTHLDSEVSGWKYVSIIPKRIFLSKAKHMRDLTLVGISLCLLIGGAAAYVFAKRNYNPVRRILETLSNRAGIAFNYEANEYEFINKSIEFTADQNKIIHQKLQKQQGILKTNFLAKLLRGNAEDYISLEEAVQSYGLDFGSDHFAVMIFLLEDITRFFPVEQERVPGESTKLARSVIANVVQELVDEQNKGFIIEEDDAVICLFNFKNTGGNFGLEAVEQIASTASGIIQQKFQIYFTVAISAIHETVYGIPQAYREAMKALEYKLVVGAGYIIKYDSVEETEKRSFDDMFTLEVQQKFINCIKAGEMDKAGDIMENVIDSNVSQGSIPVTMARCLMFAMVNTMMNAVRELSLVCDKAFIDELNPVERLLKCKTVVDIKAEMKAILVSIGEYITVSKAEKTNNLVTKMKSYVQENYFDGTLSISVISEYLDMNAAYISRYFKDQTGEGLPDYIGRTRVEKAKELLRVKNININEIAEKVGFYNSNALIRSFKKFEGVTPGKFKELKL